MRVCDICGLIDDLPRHVVAHDPGAAPATSGRALDAVLENTTASTADKAAAVAAIEDDTLQIRHIPCCAAAGCPTGTCQS